MATPQDMLTLLRQGNTNKVEQDWMDLLESGTASGEQLATYRDVIAELVKMGRAELAGTLAWAAVQSVAETRPPADAVAVAGPFLVAVGDNAELREQVSKLYETAYRDREGFDALMAEAGLRVGRPVRRAVRTLDVCLALSDGDFLAARDDEGAACVDRIDRTTWTFTLSTNDGAETLSAVSLADQYVPVSPTDLRVLRQFDRPLLLKRLNDDPASMIVEICVQHGGSIDSGKLEKVLVPDILEEGEWKKWWTRARTELKKLNNVSVEGRAPYTITCLSKRLTFEDTLRKDFDKRQHEPLVQFGLVEQYVRDCKNRKETPDPSILNHCYESFAVRAHRPAKSDATHAAMYWAMARRVGEWAAIADAGRGLHDFLRGTRDLPPAINAIEPESLRELALQAVVEARPDDWQVELLALLPTQPLAICDWVATRLIKAGRSAADFDGAVQQILATPLPHFEAVLWLWDGPSPSGIAPDVTPATLLSRVLRTLDDCRRSERLKETEKRYGARAKSVLSARRYERFKLCVETLEPGMAQALKTQLNQLDSLGRAVRDDLVDLILDKFPAQESKPKVADWAREDVLFVTEFGMKRKQAEIDHHVNVTMRENAKAIGAAAEKGDLSENSEYKFALEERDLLQARLLQMNTEMNMARLLRPDDVPSNHVGIGTRVVFRRVTDGDPYELCFLGPWEADPAKGWLNYKSPLAQGLMGRRVGDRFDFDHSGISGTYEIIELHNGMTSELVST